MIHKPRHGKQHPRPRRRRKSLVGLSSAAPRRRKTHRKGGLSDMFNPTIAMDSAKTTLMSAGGGIGAMIVNKSILPATASKATKTITALAVGFLANSFGMGKLGAGFTGGLIALTYQNGLLNDDMQDTEFADSEVLSDYPPILDEDGNPLMLEENDGEPYYRAMSDYEYSQYTH